MRESNEPNQRQQQEPQPPIRKQDLRQPVEVNADAGDASSAEAAAQEESSAAGGKGKGEAATGDVGASATTA